MKKPNQTSLVLTEWQNNLIKVNEDIYNNVMGNQQIEVGGKNTVTQDIQSTFTNEYPNGHKGSGIRIQSFKQGVIF